MNRAYKQRLDEWLIWYNYHHSTLHNASLDNRVIFLDKCCRGLFELVVRGAEETERVDLGRNKPVQIILPTGIRLDTPIRRADT